MYSIRIINVAILLAFFHIVKSKVYSTNANTRMAKAIFPDGSPTNNIADHSFRMLFRAEKMAHEIYHFPQKSLYTTPANVKIDDMFLCNVILPNGAERNPEIHYLTFKDDTFPIENYQPTPDRYWKFLNECLDTDPRIPTAIGILAQVVDWPNFKTKIDKAKITNIALAFGNFNEHPVLPSGEVGDQILDTGLQALLIMRMGK